jgi:hypothetical protein
LGQPLLLTEGVGTRPVSEQSREHRGFRSRLVADASGAPVLCDQGPIGRPGTARSIPVCCGRPRSIANTNPSSGRGEAAATS